MALSVPTVDDQRVQQALNSIATQFPLKTQLFATEVITTDKIVKEAITAALIQAEAIQASHIEAGTITATQIKAATITGDLIAANTITAANIAANTITANEIEANSITATELNVTELSAISANLGTVTAGSLDAVTITGTTIIGSTIRTAEPGTFPRVDLDSLGFRATIDIEDRVQLCTNPYGGAGTTTGWGKLGNGVFEVVTLGEGENPEPGLGPLSLGLFSAFHGTSDGGTDVPNFAFPATEGKTYRLSIWVYVEPGGEGDVVFGFWKPGFASNVDNTGPLPEGEWVRVDVGGEATSTGNYVLTLGSQTGACEWWWTATLIEESDSLGFFFPTAQQIAAEVAEWDGTPNASTSTLTAEQTIVADTISGILLVRGVLSSLDGSEIPTKHLDGQLTNAQIESIEAAKLTGQITETQITDNSISTAKLQAGSVTTNEIAANTIVAADIAAETITGTQIAATTINATKLNVSTLSAITANLGTINAGTLTGVTFQTSASNPRVYFDDEGFHATDGSGSLTVDIPDDGGAARIPGGIIASSNEVFGSTTNQVLWEDPEGATAISLSGHHAFLESPSFAQYRADLIANPDKVTIHSAVNLLAYGNESSKYAYLRPQVPNSEGGGRIAFGVTGLEEREIINHLGFSDFVQLPFVEGSTRKVVYRTFTDSITWGGSSFSEWTKVEHGLGVEPTQVFMSIVGDQRFVANSWRNPTSTTIEIGGYRISGTSTGTKTVSVNVVSTTP